MRSTGLALLGAASGAALTYAAIQLSAPERRAELPADAFYALAYYYEYCEVEDEEGCWWDAEALSNGRGESFIALDDRLNGPKDDGIVIYLER